MQRGRQRCTVRIPGGTPRASEVVLFISSGAVTPKGGQPGRPLFSPRPRAHLPHVAHWYPDRRHEPGSLGRELGFPRALQDRPLRRWPALQQGSQALPQQNSVTPLLASDVLPAWSTAFTVNVFAPLSVA